MRRRGKSKIIQGDCLDVLKQMKAGLVYCCVTSPPYFALRSYLPKDCPDKLLEIGGEGSVEEYVDAMVRVFRAVRRVMHPSGLLFLNLGDGYGDGGQLLNVPHRVAEALRADGWVWRQTICWAKPSPMPESCKGWRWVRCRVKVGDDMRGKEPYRLGACGDSPQRDHDGPDFARAKYVPCPGCPKCIPNDGWVLRRGRGRCTTAHEYVFVLAASGGYFWDSAAFVETSVGPDNRRPFGKSGNQDRKDQGRYFAESVSRNPRSVWTIGEMMYRLQDDITPEQRAFVLRRIFGGGCR